MTRAIGCLCGTLLMAGWGAAREDGHPAVLVELFTSEGCSSCPPADALLEKFDRMQTVAGAQVIAMSEHVDYWNRLGWTDPYSSPVFSRRQEAYATRFGLNGVYTPQMVVDASSEFVGNDAQKAEAAIATAARRAKSAVRLSAANGRVRVEVDAPDGGKRAGVYVAFADDSRATDVLRGENRGRKLRHVAVVHEIRKIGEFDRTGFRGEIAAAPGKRVIVFVQEGGNGRVLGAAMIGRE